MILIDNHSFEDLIVVKRSGQRVEFNSLKIAVAIKNAFDSTPSNYSNNDINKVYEETYHIYIIITKIERQLMLRIFKMS